MIVTIERPRFDYLPETDMQNGDEVPFIPVSPDSSSDEEVEYFEKKKSVYEPPHTEVPHTDDAVVPPAVEPVVPVAPAQERDVVVHQEEYQQEEQQEQEEQQQEEEPNYAFFSVLSEAFIRHVKGLENVRELWCAGEYNESFTGSEAVVSHYYFLTHSFLNNDDVGYHPRLIKRTST
jgi:hypothetical protein